MIVSMSINTAFPGGPSYARTGAV